MTVKKSKSASAAFGKADSDYVGNFSSKKARATNGHWTSMIQKFVVVISLFRFFLARVAKVYIGSSDSEPLPCLLVLRV